jgi:hypothetical protein
MLTVRARTFIPYLFSFIYAEPLEEALNPDNAEVQSLWGKSAGWIGWTHH